MDSPPLALRFRPFERADLALLGAWLVQTGLSVPALAPEQLARRLMEDPAILCLAACDATDGPVGFMRLDLSPDRAAEVTLIVSPSMFRRGIGRRMLEHGIALAREHGWHRLWALIRTENLPAQSLFERAGFEEAANPLHGYVHLVRLVHRRPSGMVAPLEIAP
ncbi:MAG: GNAT family N-acetyltransferase [Planctomycetota bacterium]